MKDSIHPTYHDKAKVTCATCGSVLVTGSTIADVRIEVCSQCHPFYTGKQNLVDTAGRVDRFKRILKSHDTARTARGNKTAAKRKSATEA